ncbi:MAG: GDSL-type esterase/lipase family protein [Solirubrobacterales bacterium]
MKATAAAALALALVLAPTASAQPPSLGAGSVLVIGDSLGVGTEPDLERQLYGTRITNDSEVGRPSSAGLEPLRSLLSPSDSVVVFALGTNDSTTQTAAFAANLEQAASIAGDRCLVIPTLARPPVDGVPVDGMNAVIRGFAVSHPNVEVVDWHAAVASQPNLLFDGVHPVPEGYALRASMIAQAVDTCLVSGLGGAAPAPKPQDLSEGATRPAHFPRPKPPPATQPAQHEKPITTARAYKILADAVSSQIAIGALE